MGKAKVKPVRNGSYKKTIMKLLKEKYEENNRQGVSRAAMYTYFTNNFELKSESTMRRFVSKRVKELVDDEVITSVNGHPHSFKLTKKGVKSFGKKLTKKVVEAPKRGKQIVSKRGKKIAEKPKRGKKAAKPKRASRARIHHAQTSTQMQPELVWAFTPEDATIGTGLFVNDNYVYFCEGSSVYVLNPLSGQIIRKINFENNSRVNCIVGDHNWLYCGLNNGEVYDLTNEVPRLMITFNSESNNLIKSIEWIDVYDGYIAIDAHGTCALLNMEGDIIWRNDGFSTNRFVRTDGNYIYHCRNNDVTAYRFMTGEVVWTGNGGPAVTFGSMDTDHIYTAPFEVRALRKSDGELMKQYFGNIPWAVSTNERFEDGEPNQIFTSDTLNLIYCYDKETCELKWIVKIPDNSKGVSLQYFKGYLYCTTDRGSIFCYNVKNIIKSSNTSNVNYVTNEGNIEVVVPSDNIEVSSNRSGKILVQVVNDGTKERIRVDPSETGFNSDLNIQFPRNLRTPGSKFLVDDLVLNNQGTFYRVKGNILKYKE